MKTIEEIREIFKNAPQTLAKNRINFFDSNEFKKIVSSSIEEHASRGFNYTLLDYLDFIPDWTGMSLSAPEIHDGCSKFLESDYKVTVTSSGKVRIQW